MAQPLKQVEDAAPLKHRRAPSLEEGRKRGGQLGRGHRPPLGLAPKGEGVALAAEAQNHA